MPREDDFPPLDVDQMPPLFAKETKMKPMPETKRPGDLFVRNNTYGYEVALLLSPTRAAVIGMTKDGLELKVRTIETDTTAAIVNQNRWTKASDTHWAAWEAAAKAEGLLK